MKHEKEWYTCDRCGKEIKEIPPNAICKKVFRTKFCTSAEFRASTTDRVGYGRISEAELTIPEVTSMEIVESYITKTRTIHLCGECRKEFGRFLKK